MSDPLNQHPNRNRRAVFGWTMYDWANSVYSLTITTAIFPPFFHYMARQVAVNRDEILAAKAAGLPEPTAIVKFLGFEMQSVGMLSMSLIFAYLFIAVFSPMLAALADYSGKKKRFMLGFTLLGALSCSGMYFFGPDSIYLGFWLFVLAAIGYAGGVIFNDAFLPEVAAEKDYDRVSARGYSMGYIGSVILLCFNLAMVMFPEKFFSTEGRSEGDLNILAPQVSFATVGIWWLGFALVTFFSLKDTAPKEKPKNYIAESYRELRKVWRMLNDSFGLRIYLLAYFCFNLGIQTVMYMASSFGSEELHMKTEDLIISILIIQLIAVPGSFLFSWLSGKRGNFNALLSGIIFWILLLILAWFVTDANGFYVLGGLVGLVMGGMQALSRATFTKLIPDTHDSASFFSFYSLVDKISIVTGMALFGLISEHLGMRKTILLLEFFFIAGGLCIFMLKRRLNKNWNPA